METIRIRINRIGSVMSRINPYEVWFKGIKLGNIMKDGDGVFTINREKGVLKIREFGTKLAFHTIQKEVVIFPEQIKKDNNELVCNVIASMNWLGVITLGLFAPIRNISVEIKS